MLAAGAVLAPCKRTVIQALWVMVLAEEVGFARYHEVLSRERRHPCALARQTLLAAHALKIAASMVSVAARIRLV